MLDRQDAYGHMLWDHLNGREVTELVERDDGFIGTSGGPGAYFAEYRQWPRRQRIAMRYVKGRVLDVGCGAGRVALYLQRKGYDVTGIDNSPLAVQTCMRRGLRKARVTPITRLRFRQNSFDTVVMFGNNFGLFANKNRAKWLLRRLRRIVSSGGSIIAETLDPYATNDPAHLRYHRLNRGRNRMGGQVRIRVRYRNYATPWFDYLFISRKEMRGILNGTGWEVAKFLNGKSSVYIVVMRKSRVNGHR